MNILITGASRGIGECIAKNLDGTIFAIGRNEDKLKQYKNYLVCDFEKDIDKLGEYITSNNIDVIINNAGEYIYKEANYERYDIYESNNYFEALINNKYGIQVAEVLTKEIDEQYKMNNMNNFDYKYQYGNQELSQNTEIKFRGLFAKIDMEKSINSELKIMQDGKMIFEKNKVNMDSSEFEKYFDVKSSNQIITMQILTSDVMEELVEFENKTKMKFDIYINNKELYIRFHSGSLSVDISDFKNGALDEAIMKKYFYMLNFTYNLSSRLIEVINDIEI